MPFGGMGACETCPAGRGNGVPSAAAALGWRAELRVCGTDAPERHHHTELKTAIVRTRDDAGFVDLAPFQFQIVHLCIEIQIETAHAFLPLFRCHPAMLPSQDDGSRTVMRQFV